MIRADCHFHPNFTYFFPERMRLRKARKIWNAFAKRKLDVVFVSEHAYRHPRRSFQTLEKAKPTHARTLIVPAVEALTKEGIDVIVFSADQHVYERADIIKPYSLGIDELIRRVRRDPKLHAVICHPSIPSVTGILHHRTEKRAEKEMHSLGCVERFNSSLIPLEQFLERTGLARVLRRLYAQACDTVRLPARFMGDGIIGLGGSDAHFVWEIGSCLIVDAPKPHTVKQALASLLSPRTRRTFVWRAPAHEFLDMIIDSFHAGWEHMQKVFHLYRIDRVNITS